MCLYVYYYIVLAPCYVFQYYDVITTAAVYECQHRKPHNTASTLIHQPLLFHNIVLT